MEVNKKFIESININDFEVMTDTGWHDIKKSHKTIKYTVWELSTKNFNLKCADNHIVIDVHYNEIFVKDLNIGDIILTEVGPEEILLISETKESENMYDLQLSDNSNHLYYTNGILSHNTTVCMDIISDLHRAGYKVLFISGEMNRIDLYKYVQRYPKFGEIDILFMNEHLDESPKLVIETQLNEGYDIVLGDSFVEIQDTIKEAMFMTTGATEKWIIDLMISHNMGNNDLKKYTTFLMIQQVTKGGNFVGSNKLKHNTTGMMEMRWTKSGEAYIEMNKNRRGPVNKKLYFKLDNPDDVYYDINRFQMEENNRQMLNEEQDELEKESADFDNMFKDTGVSNFIDNVVNISAEDEMEQHENEMIAKNS